MDTELALQEAVAKYAMPTRVAEKAVRTAMKDGPKLVLRAKRRVHPLKYQLVKKGLPSALKLGMLPTSAYGKARLEAHTAGKILVPKGLRMKREGKAMQQEATALVRRQQRNAYGHLSEPQRDRVFRDMGEQQFRAQEPGLFLEVSGEHLSSNALRAGRAAKGRAKALSKGMTDGDIATELAWQKKNHWKLAGGLINQRKPKRLIKPLTPQERAQARASLTKPEGQNYPL